MITITNNGGENKATYYIFGLTFLYYVLLVLGVLRNLHVYVEHAGRAQKKLCKTQQSMKISIPPHFNGKKGEAFMNDPATDS
jgi:hypothetical protein